MWYGAKNLSTEKVAQIQEPWKTQSPLPAFKTKKEFREWCINDTTSHVFFSSYEGLTPGLRINEDNPAIKQYAFVADYDTDIKLKDAVDLIEKQAKRVRPTYVCATYSNGIRAVWPFEKDVLCDQLDIHKKFLELLIKDLHVEHIAPGFDPASKRTNQLWELGTNWTAIKDAVPVSKDTIISLTIDACRRAKIQMETGAIPFDVLEKELHSRYPGRWKGDFTFGARGPLFWVNDGIDRIGCVALDHGIKNFSTRDHRGFLTWETLFGKDFVKGYKEKRLASAIEGIYYDGHRFWEKNGSNLWYDSNKDDTIMTLKVRGISHRIAAKKTCSEAEEVINMIRTKNRVMAVAPFLYIKKDFVTHNGVRYLNTSPSEAMSPTGDGDPKNFPWLSEFLEKIWENCSTHPHPAREYFLAWLKRFWESAYQGCPQVGHVIVIAGPPGIGKSLLASFILRKIMGGGTDASSYLLHGGGFNKEMGERAVWNVDDGQSASDLKSHKKFTEMLKKHVANPEVNYHPKYKDSIVLPWRGRITITCNYDSESLAILPNLDSAVLDKIMLFKFRDDWKPAFYDESTLETLIDTELPYFLGALHKWKIPQDLIDVENPRYGVLPYHHRDLVTTARDASPAQALRELLEIWRRDWLNNKPEEDWVGSCTKLHAELYSHVGLQSSLRSFNTYNMGRYLKQIAGYEDWLDVGGKTHGITKYVIKREDT